jgi:hypothetical protein
VLYDPGDLVSNITLSHHSLPDLLARQHFRGIVGVAHFIQMIEEFTTARCSGWLVFDTNKWSAGRPARKRSRRM